jgi:hypothetical protein
MENSSAVRQSCWDEQQRAITAQTDLDDRAWLKNFALVFSLIALTLAVASELAGLDAGVTIRL